MLCCANSGGQNFVATRLSGTYHKRANLQHFGCHTLRRNSEHLFVHYHHISRTFCCFVYERSGKQILRHATKRIVQQHHHSSWHAICTQLSPTRCAQPLRVPAAAVNLAPQLRDGRILAEASGSDLSILRVSGVCRYGKCKTKKRCLDKL